MELEIVDNRVTCEMYKCDVNVAGCMNCCNYCAGFGETTMDCNFDPVNYP